jgi:uroporphyrin-3 C-methyltransferase
MRSLVRLPLGMHARDNARPMTDSTAPAPHTHRVTLLIAIVGVAIACYALWRSDNTRDREDATRDRVQQLETANTALHTELTAAIERETKLRADLMKKWQQLADLPQQVKDLTAAHEDLRARTERPQRAWSRAEALYLIELAQRRLNFDRDTQTAMVALESADSRLASLRDPSLTAVRERIAKDLQALRATPVPDRTGIVARLLAVEKQIESASLKGTLVGQRTPEDADASQSILQRTWASLSSAISRLFSVRHIDNSHGAIVSLEEQALRRQHFSLLGFSARNAVMRNDQTGYRSAIDAMRSWLAQYFDATPADAAARELAALTEINIAPTLPDVSGAAQMLTRVAPATQAVQ